MGLPMRFVAPNGDGPLLSASLRPFHTYAWLWGETGLPTNLNTRRIPLRSQLLALATKLIETEQSSTLKNNIQSGYFDPQPAFLGHRILSPEEDLRPLLGQVPSLGEGIRSAGLSTPWSSK